MTQTDASTTTTAPPLTRAAGAGAILPLLAFAALCTALAAWLLSRTDFNEDAAILFRYAQNLAETGRISYNPGGPTAEGATDFLFMVMVAAGSALGLSEYAASLAINFAALILCLRLFQVLLDLSGAEVFALGLLHLALSGTFAAYLGFGVIAFEATLLLAIHGLVRERPWRFYPAVLLMCLMRPDGVVFGAGLTLWMLWRRHGRGDLTAFATGLILPGIAYFLWRWWYFGAFLPLPFYVKSDATRDVLGLFQSESLIGAVDAALPVALVCVTALFFRGGNRIPAPARAAIAVSVLLVPILFYGAMRLDQNIGNRFFHFVPVALLLLCLDADPARNRRLATLVAMAALALFMNRFGVPALSHGLVMPGLARDLAPMNLTVATTEAGHFALHSRAETTDLWGLNTARFARAPAGTDEVAGGRYDLILLNRNIGPGCEEPLAIHRAARDMGGFPDPMPRDWYLMTDAVMNGINPGVYALYSVPFFTERNNRGDLLFVRRSMEPDIAPVLIRHGAERCG